MEKKNDPPRAKNVAPAGFVPALQERAERLGVTWEDVVNRAQLSTTTAWRLTSGSASLATARKVERVLDELEKARGGATSADRESRIAEWIIVGREIFGADRERFDRLLASLRLLAQRLQLEKQIDEQLLELLSVRTK